MCVSVSPRTYPPVRCCPLACSATPLCPPAAAAPGPGAPHTSSSTAPPSAAAPVWKNRKQIIENTKQCDRILAFGRQEQKETFSLFGARKTGHVLTGVSFGV